MDKELIDSLDSGNQKKVPNDILHDYQLIRSASEYLGESELKVRMNDIHNMVFNPFQINKVLVWISGIAASIILGFFLFTENGGLNRPVLKSHDIPVYADSATYDSINILENYVDKLSKQKSINDSVNR
jgi:hypothetical protein